MQESIYQQLGGEPSIDKAVNIFYRKVLRDEEIKGFFTNIDMSQQILKQKAFLTMLLGGPNAYSGKDLRAGHAHLVRDQGLNDSHFNAVLKHLRSTFEDLSVPAEMISTILATAEAARDTVLGR